MQNYELDSGKLFILSAPPASGKSTFLKNNNIPEHMILSADTLRSNVLGNSVGIDHLGQYNIPLYNNDARIFGLLTEMLKMRMKEKLTTFLDITAVKDSDRADFAKIARSAGVDTEVLIFDVDKETCLRQDKKRINRVGEQVINNFFQKFERESKFTFKLINSETSITLQPNKLNGTNYDIIGDTHGFYSEFIDFAKTKLGYEHKNGLLTHPEGRKMLFLGDFVDRGTESIEMLTLVKRMCDNGHKAIIGNHENKLIQFYQNLQLGKVSVSSRSSSETAMKFVKLDKKRQEDLYQWLVSLPHYYTEDKFAFTHAGVTHFDPFNTPRSFCIYGDQRSKLQRATVDSDYHELKANNLNDYYLIRGHNSLTDPKQTSVISLDNDVGFKGGTLNALHLEECIRAKKINSYANLESFVIRTPVNFDYTEYMATQFKIQTLMTNLKKEKLSSERKDDTGFLSLYKYSKSVFYNQSWSEDPALLKCRGIVLDLAGNIVIHPFDKIFNYGEKNQLKQETAKSILNNEPVVMVEKMNGYLGLITKHPYKDNQLLITTQGTFERYSDKGEIIQSEYAGYVRDLITKELNGKLFQYLSQNDVTLMFEVVHPEDKNNHIIEYDKSEEGLYLIGVRGKKLNDHVFTEEEMDIVGKKINCKRPKHFKTTFGEAMTIVENSEIEGFMLRKDDGKEQEYICKFKTPHYLIVKFLGRMGKANFHSMYKNPESFKQKPNVEEEFYPLIDYLVKNIKKEDFYEMSEDDRKELVKKAIQSMRVNDFENLTQFINQKVETSIPSPNRVTRKL